MRCSDVEVLGINPHTFISITGYLGAVLTTTVKMFWNVEKMVTFGSHSHTILSFKDRHNCQWDFS